jgi:hypothetical protein
MPTMAAPRRDLVRSPIAWIVAALAVGAVIAATLFIVRGDGRDARRDWVSAADAECRQAATELASAGALAEGVDTSEWAGAAAETHRDLARRLRGIDPAGADDVADEVVAAFDERVRLLAAHADGDIDGDELSDSLDANYTTVRDATFDLDGRDCGHLVVAGWAPDTPEELVAETTDSLATWSPPVDALCVTAATDMADLDAAAGLGDLEPEQYLQQLAEVLESLGDEIAAAGPPPDDETLLAAHEQLLDGLAAAAAAAEAGDRAAVNDAVATWSDAAATLALAACAEGIGTSSTSPSGIVAAPAVPPLADGVDAAQITEVDTVAAYVTAWMRNTAGVLPDDAFGVTRVPPAAVDGLTVVDGATAATATAVSVSDAVRATPSDPAAPPEVWVVGVAFTDTAGRCTWGQLFGPERLDGYTVLPATGPCTGDAAAAAFS